MMNNKKIVITGIGMIGPFGVTCENFWNGITEGRSFLRPVTRYKFPRLSGEVPDFSIRDFIKNPKYERLPLISKYAIASAISAISNAKIELKKTDLKKIAVFFGTCNGPALATEKICDTLIERGRKFVDPLLFQESVFNAPASLISIYFGLKGPCIALPMGYASGAYALSTAINYIKSYDIDYAVVVGADELCQTVHEAYSNLKILSPNDDAKEGMRPFDRTRNGMVLSEGAVSIILETKDKALQREAKFYGQIEGHAMASDGYKLADNNPDGSGLSRTITIAMNDAGVSSNNIDYIASTALSLKKIDIMETRAIKKVLGNKAYDIPVSSIKSSIGITFGVCGLFNLVAGLFAIRDSIVPPTVNFQYSDDECDLDIVPNVARKKQVDIVLSNSFSWGGIYSSVILRRCE